MAAITRFGLKLCNRHFALSRSAAGLGTHSELVTAFIFPSSPYLVGFFFSLSTVERRQEELQFPLLSIYYFLLRKSSQLAR